MRALTTVALTVALIVGGSPAWAGDDEHTIRGTFQLVSSDTQGPRKNCRGSGGYGDIAPGLVVKIRDGRDDVIASTALGRGGRPRDYPTVTCVFRFKVDVPDTDFYSVSIGDRGELGYTRKQLERRKWRVEASISD